MNDSELKVFEISEDELDCVTGGAGDRQSTMKHRCDNCNKETTFNLYSGGRAICSVCGSTKML